MAMFSHNLALKSSTRCPQDAPRRSQDCHKTGQEGPQDTCKTPPRRPKTSSRRLQDGPRCAQDAPKTPYESPRTPQGTPRRLQDAPRRLQTSILVPRDLDFEFFWHRQTTPWTPWQRSNVFMTWPGGMREAIKLKIGRKFDVFLKKWPKTEKWSFFDPKSTKND